jgi:UDP-glucose 6-dehydrogenase
VISIGNTRTGIASFNCQATHIAAVHAHNTRAHAEGTAIDDLMAPDRVLIGGEQTDAGKAAIEVRPSPISTYQLGEQAAAKSM